MIDDLINLNTVKFENSFIQPETLSKEIKIKYFKDNLSAYYS